MGKLNRLGCISNGYQGASKKVLCVCSAGLLRSPTAAVVLSQEPFNFNTRAVGISVDFALIPIDEVLIAWADQIVCMEKWHRHEVEQLVRKHLVGELPQIVCLNIPDDFAYRAPELLDLIKIRYLQATIQPAAP